MLAQLHNWTSSRRGHVQAIKDDYHHWALCEFSAGAGKPIWLDLREDTPACHTVFLDDNNRLSHTDEGVADLRVVATAERLVAFWNVLGVHGSARPAAGRFCSCAMHETSVQSGASSDQASSQCKQACTSQYVCACVPQRLVHLFRDIVLVQADPLAAVLDFDYFVNKVEECERRFGELLHKLQSAEAAVLVP